MSGADWSKQEKEIARRAFKAAHERECKAIAHNVRKMAFGINDPTGLWRLSEYLFEMWAESSHIT